MPPPISTAELHRIVVEHIGSEEAVWRELREGQQRFDDDVAELRLTQARIEGKLDDLLAEMHRHGETVDQIREVQAAGRVATRAIKWLGGIAAAAAGIVALWVALRGSHPPLPPNGGPH